MADKKAVAYLPVKYYSFPTWRRPLLALRNYKQMRRLGATLKTAVRCAIREALHGCTIVPPKRPARTIDNLGLVITLD